MGCCDTTTSSTSHSACNGVPESGNGKHVISGGNLTVSWCPYGYPGYLSLGRFARSHATYQRINHFGGRGHLVIDNTEGNPINISIGDNRPGTDETLPDRLQYMQTSDSILEVKLSSEGTTATVDVNLNAVLSGTLLVDDTAFTAAEGAWAIGDTIDILKSGQLNVTGTGASVSGVVTYKDLPDTDVFWTTAGVRSIPDLIIDGPNALNRQINTTITEGFRPRVVEVGADNDDVLQVVYTYLGDADLDCDVDSTDYSLWMSGYGTAGVGVGWDEGDFDGDLDVDSTDYSLWMSKYGSTAPPGTIPEPITMTLLGIGGLALLRRRRR